LSYTAGHTPSYPSYPTFYYPWAANESQSSHILRTSEIAVNELFPIHPETSFRTIAQRIRSLHLFA
ncbi:hypothetical protein TNCT_647721, partial [Trichonephila clavata]